MAVSGKSTHKNASRSRHLIKQAFGELINEKPLSKITVTDIVKRANISRGTFYAHYLDVQDLYNAIQNNILETLDAGVDQVGINAIICNPSGMIRKGMKILSEDKNYYSLFMFSPYAISLLEIACARLVERLTPVIVANVPPQDISTVTFFMTYTLGAQVVILTQWFTGRIQISGEECANYLADYYMRSRPREVIELTAKLSGGSSTMIG